MKHVLLAFIIMLGMSGNAQTDTATLSKKVGTIEIVIFKTHPQYAKEEVVAAAKALTPVVENYAGYISRTLAIDKEGTWTDIVHWESLEAAEHAAQEIMKSEVCQKFFNMIDEKSMQFMHVKPVLSTH